MVVTPKVSVVIPSYNRPGPLSDAIESVSQQSYGNIEIIVVNDCSSISYEDVKNIDNPRIKYIEHDKNQGACAARNTGIENSTGQYIAFLDDDDRWHPNKIESQVYALEEESSELCYTDTLHITPSGEISSITSNKIKDQHQEEIILENFIGPLSTVVVSKQSLEQVGGFDENYPAWQDWELYIRLAQICNICYVNEPLTHYYTGSDDRISDNIDSIKQALYLFFSDKSDKSSFSEKKIHSRWYSTVARYCLATGKNSEARRFAMHSLIDDPFHFMALVTIILSFGSGLLYNLYKHLKKLKIQFITSN